VPEIVVKNLSSSLISLPVGQLPAKGVRSFNLDLVRLEQLKVVLGPMRERGHVEFWTNDALLASEHVEASLRGKTEALNDMEQRLASIDAMAKRAESVLDAAGDRSKNINTLHDKVAFVDSVVEKAAKIEAALARAAEFNSLLESSSRIEFLLSQLEEVDRASTRLAGLESLASTLQDRISEATEIVSELRVLRDQLSSRVQTPLTEVLSESSARLVSCSSKTPVEVPDLQFEDVPVGTWLATFECSLSSPTPASGKVFLLCGEALAGERATGMLNPEGNAPFVMTELLRLSEPTQVHLQWQADSSKSLRMTTRRLTLLKVTA